MRVRTYVGMLMGLAAVLVASYLTHQNRDFLSEPFRLGGETSVPLWTVLLTVFLLGFLPTVTLLLVATVRRDLEARQERRRGRESTSLDASFHRAVDFEADGQWARAAGELSVVLAERPEDFAALLRYGEVLRMMGRAEEALEVHRQASVQHPRSVALLYQLSDDYQVRGEPQVAREVEDRILRDHPGMGLAILRRRRDAALGTGDWRRAAELHGRIRELLGEGGSGPELAEEAEVEMGLDYQRGVALLEEDEVEPAVAVFQGILEREPRFIPAAIMLGEAELLRDAPEAAVQRWLEGYRETGSPVFLQRIEDHSIEREDPQGAIETLRRLIAATGNAVLPRFFLGRLYYRLEMHDEALKVLAGLEERIGVSPTYHFLLGCIRQRRGEMGLALASFAACARQLGVPQAEYRCSVCRSRYPEWHDRCEVCGSWNAVAMDFEEERVSAEELGVRPRPVWTVPEASGGGEEAPEPTGA